MRKHVIRFIGIMWCVALIFVMYNMFAMSKDNSVNAANEDYTSKIEKITFNDKKTELDNYTGLLNIDIENKLNEAGVFDFEIERLSKEDRKSLNSVEVQYIDVQKTTSKIKGIKSYDLDMKVNYEKKYNIDENEIMGKTIKLDGWAYLGITSVLYRADSEKHEAGMINLYTWYNIPKTKGYDIMTITDDNEVHIKSYKAYAKYGYIDNSKVEIDEFNTNFKTHKIDNAIYREDILRVMTDKIKNASNITYVTSAKLESETKEIIAIHCSSGYYHQILNINHKNDLYDYFFDINNDYTFCGGIPQVSVSIKNNEEIEDNEEIEESIQE